ncbi:MAG: hypothetical protein KKG01_03575, partial [Candidatus Omnitrophica bacterium]|nr:hypothetical protein [Candidatus Omnitrophota bacterium]
LLGKIGGIGALKGNISFGTDLWGAKSVTITENKDRIIYANRVFYETVISDTAGYDAFGSQYITNTTTLNNYSDPNLLTEIDLNGLKMKVFVLKDYTVDTFSTSMDIFGGDVYSFSNISYTNGKDTYKNRDYFGLVKAEYNNYTYKGLIDALTDPKVGLSEEEAIEFLAKHGFPEDTLPDAEVFQGSISVGTDLWGAKSVTLTRYEEKTLGQGDVYIIVANRAFFLKPVNTTKGWDAFGSFYTSITATVNNYEKTTVSINGLTMKDITLLDSYEVYTANHSQDIFGSDVYSISAYEYDNDVQTEKGTQYWGLIKDQAPKALELSNDLDVFTELFASPVERDDFIADYSDYFEKHGCSDLSGITTGSVSFGQDLWGGRSVTVTSYLEVDGKKAIIYANKVFWLKVESKTIGIDAFGSSYVTTSTTENTYKHISELANAEDIMDKLDIPAGVDPLVLYSYKVDSFTLTDTFGGAQITLSSATYYNNVKPHDSGRYYWGFDHQITGTLDIDKIKAEYGKIVFGKEWDNLTQAEKDEISNILMHLGVLNQDGTPNFDVPGYGDADTITIGTDMWGTTSVTLSITTEWLSVSIGTPKALTTHSVTRGGDMFGSDFTTTSTVENKYGKLKPEQKAFLGIPQAVDPWVMEYSWSYSVTEGSDVTGSSYTTRSGVKSIYGVITKESRPIWGVTEAKDATPVQRPVDDALPVKKGKSTGIEYKTVIAPYATTEGTDIFGNTYFSITRNTYGWIVANKALVTYSHTHTEGSNLDGSTSTTDSYVTYDYFEGTERNDIAQSLFSLDYDQLNDTQKEQVNDKIAQAMLSKNWIELSDDEIDWIETSLTRKGMLKSASGYSKTEGSDVFGNGYLSVTINTYNIVAGKAVVIEAFTVTQSSSIDGSKSYTFGTLNYDYGKSSRALFGEDSFSEREYYAIIKVYDAPLDLGKALDVDMPDAGLGTIWNYLKTTFGFSGATAGTTIWDFLVDVCGFTAYMLNCCNIYSTKVVEDPDTGFGGSLSVGRDLFGNISTTLTQNDYGTEPLESGQWKPQYTTAVTTGQSLDGSPSVTISKVENIYGEHTNTRTGVTGKAVLIGKKDVAVAFSDDNAFGAGSWWGYIVVIFSAGFLAGFKNIVSRTEGDIPRAELVQRLRSLGILGANEDLDDFAKRHGFDSFKDWYYYVKQEGGNFTEVVLDAIWKDYMDNFMDNLVQLYGLDSDGDGVVTDDEILEYLQDANKDLNNDGKIDSDDVYLFKMDLWREVLLLAANKDSFMTEWRPFVNAAFDYTVITETFWRLDSSFSSNNPQYGLPGGGSITISSDVFGNMSLTVTHNTYILTDNGEVKVEISESKTLGSSLDGSWTKTQQKVTYEYTKWGETDVWGNIAVPEQVKQKADKAIYAQGYVGLLKKVTWAKDWDHGIGISEGTDFFGNKSTSYITNTYVIIAGKALVKESITETIGGQGPTGDNVYSKNTTTYYYTDGSETVEKDGDIVRLNRGGDKGTDQYVLSGVDFIDPGTGKVYRGIIWKVEGESIIPEERPEEFRSDGEGGIGLWGATDILGNRNTSETEMRYILWDGRAKIEYSKTTSTYYNTGISNSDWGIKEIVTEVTYDYTTGAETRNEIAGILFNKDYSNLTDEEKNQVDAYCRYGLNSLGISREDFLNYDGTMPLWNYLCRLLIEKGIVSTEEEAAHLLKGIGITEEMLGTMTAWGAGDPSVSAGKLYRFLLNLTWSAGGEAGIWRGILKSATAKINTQVWEADQTLLDADPDHLKSWVKGDLLTEDVWNLPNFVNVINHYKGLDLDKLFAEAAEYDPEELLRTFQDLGILDHGETLDEFAQRHGHDSWQAWQDTAGNDFGDEVISAAWSDYQSIKQGLAEDARANSDPNQGNNFSTTGDAGLSWEEFSNQINSCYGEPRIDIIFGSGEDAVTLRVTRDDLEELIRIVKEGQDYTGTITFQIINGKAQSRIQDEIVLKKTEDPQNPGSYSYMIERIRVENNYDLTTGRLLENEDGKPRTITVWRNGECWMNLADIDDVLESLGISRKALVSFYKSRRGKTLTNDSPYDFWVDAILEYFKDIYGEDLKGFKITVTLKDGSSVSINEQELMTLLWGGKISKKDINGNDVVDQGFNCSLRKVYLDQHLETIEWAHLYQSGGFLIGYKQKTRSETASSAWNCSEHSIFYKKVKLYTGIEIWEMAGHYIVSYKKGYLYTLDEWNKMSDEEKEKALWKWLLAENPELGRLLTWYAGKIKVGKITPKEIIKYLILLNKLVSKTEYLLAEGVRPSIDTSGLNDRTVSYMSGIGYDEYGRMTSYKESIKQDKLVTVNIVTDIKYNNRNQIISKRTETTRKGSCWVGKNNWNSQHVTIDEWSITEETNMQYNAFNQLISMDSEIILYKWLDKDNVVQVRGRDGDTGIDEDSDESYYKHQRFFYDSSGQMVGTLEDGIDPENRQRYYTCSAFEYNSAGVVSWNSRSGWRQSVLTPSDFKDSNGKTGEYFSDNMIFAKYAIYAYYANRWPSNWRIDESETCTIEGKECYAVYDESTNKLIGYMYAYYNKHTDGGRFYEILGYVDDDNNVWENEDNMLLGANPDYVCPGVFFSSVQDDMSYNSRLQLVNFHEKGNVNGYVYEFWRMGIGYNALGLVAVSTQYGYGSESGTGADPKDAKKDQGLWYVVDKWEMVYNRNGELTSHRESSYRQYRKNNKVKCGDGRDGSESEPISNSYKRDPETGWLIKIATWGDWENDKSEGGGTYYTYYDYDKSGVLAGKRNDDKGVWSKEKWTFEKIAKTVFWAVVYGFLGPVGGWLAQGAKRWLIDGEDFGDAFDLEELAKGYAFAILGKIIDGFTEGLMDKLGLGKKAVEKAGIGLKITREVVITGLQVAATGFILWAASGFKDNPFNDPLSLLAIIVIVVSVRLLGDVINKAMQKIGWLKSGTSQAGTKKNVWEMIKADFSLKGRFTVQNFKASVNNAVFDTMAQIGTDQLSDKDTPDYLKPLYLAMAVIGNLNIDSRGTSTKPGGGMEVIYTFNYLNTFIAIAVDAYYSYHSRFKDWHDIKTDKDGNKAWGDVKLRYQLGRILIKRSLMNFFIPSQPKLTLNDQYGKKDNTLSGNIVVDNASLYSEVRIKEVKDVNGSITLTTTIIRKPGTKGRSGIISIKQSKDRAAYSKDASASIFYSIVNFLPQGFLQALGINLESLEKGLNEDTIKVSMGIDSTNNIITFSLSGVVDKKEFGKYSFSVDLKNEKITYNNEVNEADSLLVKRLRAISNKKKVIYVRVSVGTKEILPEKAEKDLKKKIAEASTIVNKEIKFIGLSYNIFGEVERASFLATDDEGEDELVGIYTLTPTGSSLSIILTEAMKQEIKDYLRSSNVEITKGERNYIEQVIEYGEFTSKLDEDTGEVTLSLIDQATDSEGRLNIVELRIRNQKGGKVIKEISEVKNWIDRDKRLNTEIINFDKVERAKMMLSEESLKKQETEREAFDEKFGEQKDKAIDALIEEILTIKYSELSQELKELKAKFKEYFKEAIGRGNLGAGILMLLKKAMDKIGKKLEADGSLTKAALVKNLKNNIVSLIKETIKDNLETNPQIAKKALTQIIETIQSENFIGNKENAKFLEDVLDGVFEIERSKSPVSVKVDGKKFKFTRLTIVKFADKLDIKENELFVSEEKVTMIVKDLSGKDVKVEFEAGSYFYKDSKNENRLTPMQGAVATVKGGKDKGDVGTVTPEGFKNLTKTKRTV